MVVRKGRENESIEKRSQKRRLEFEANCFLNSSRGVVKLLPFARPHNYQTQVELNEWLETTTITTARMPLLVIEFNSLANITLRCPLKSHLSLSGSCRCCCRRRRRRRVHCWRCLCRQLLGNNNSNHYDDDDSLRTLIIDIVC